MSKLQPTSALPGEFVPASSPVKARCGRLVWLLATVAICFSSSAGQADEEEGTGAIDGALKEAGGRGHCLLPLVYGRSPLPHHHLDDAQIGIDLSIVKLNFYSVYLTANLSGCLYGVQTAR